MADLPAALLLRLQQLAGNRCGYCQTSVPITGQPLTVEHIIPVARGGSSREENLWLSCRRGNESKGRKLTRQTQTPASEYQCLIRVSSHGMSILPGRMMARTSLD